LEKGGEGGFNRRHTVAKTSLGASRDLIYEISPNPSFPKRGKPGPCSGRSMPGIIIALILVLLCFGCVTVGGMPEAQKQGNLHLIQNVPFFPQEDYQCGPASLASVMNYRGVFVSPDDVAKSIYSRSAKGTLGIDLALYAHSRGLEASQYKGEMDDLRAKIDSDQPLIVLVDYGFSVFQANHFMVVIGYSEGGVVVNSGRQEKKFVPLDDFMKTWKKTGYWTLLITHKQ
jgi:predicted double-glycine peptidase